MSDHILIRSVDRESGSSQEGRIRMNNFVFPGTYNLDYFVLKNSIYNLNEEATMRAFTGTDEIGGPFYSLVFEPGLYSPSRLLDLIQPFLVANTTPATISFNEEDYTFTIVSTGDWGFYLEGDGKAELQSLLGIPNDLTEYVTGTIRTNVAEYASVPYIMAEFTQLSGMNSSLSSLSPSFIITSATPFQGVIRYHEDIQFRVDQTRYFDYRFEKPDGSLVDFRGEDWILTIKN